MTIATKEQERKALEQIKTLVKSLGENSYLEAAFDGAFGLAEQNIDNDAAFTTRYYIERVIKAEDTEKSLKEELSVTKESLEATKSAHGIMVEKLDAAKNEAKKYAFEAADMKDRLDIANQEILKLKAKLYDYMTISA